MQSGVERKRVSKAPAERREEILDAAIRVFAHKRISEATVAEITREAGVAKGTFYLYFDSKEQLLGALKARMVDDILAHASSLYERVGHQDWWALVDTFAESYVDFMIEHRDMCQIMVQEGVSYDADPVFAECNARINEMLVASLRAGVRDGVFSTTDAELTARLLHHAIDGTLINSLLYDREPEVDRDRLVAAIRELVRKSLAA